MFEIATTTKHRERITSINHRGFMELFTDVNTFERMPINAYLLFLLSVDGSDNVIRC